MLKNILYALLVLISLPAIFVLAIYINIVMYIDYRGFNPDKDVSPYAWIG
jgi:hypothetical protein